MATREERAAKKQMRILRRSFDNLQREYEDSKWYKADYVEYSKKLERMIDNATRSSGFEPFPHLVVDKVTGKPVPLRQVLDKGGVKLRA
jgi:hypothetical protein